MSSPFSATRRIASTYAAPLVSVYGSSLQLSATSLSSVSVVSCRKNGVELSATTRTPCFAAAS